MLEGKLFPNQWICTLGRSLPVPWASRFDRRTCSDVAILWPEPEMIPENLGKEMSFLDRSPSNQERS